MSNGSQTRWKYAQQTAYDTTAGPAQSWANLRFNGGGLSRATSTEEDPEIGGAAGSTTSESAATGDFDISLWYGQLDAFMEALFGGTWASDVLVPGSTLRFFTVEEHQPDLQSGNKFTQFVNAVPTGLSLTLPSPNGRITGSLSLSASNGDDSAATVAGGAAVAANTAPVMRTGSLVTDLEIDSTAVASLGLRISNVALEFTRETEDEPQVDVQGRGSISYGDLTANITLTAYDEDRTILNSMFANISRDIGFSVRDTNGDGYDFLFTAASPNGGAASSPAKNTTRTQELPFTCQDVQITRVTA